MRRWVQTSEISLRVSSLTEAQLDISKDAKRGHAVAAARTPASDNLIQADTSKLISRRQWSIAEAVPVRFNDSVSSCGHLHVQSIPH